MRLLSEGQSVSRVLPLRSNEGIGMDRLVPTTHALWMPWCVSMHAERSNAHARVTSNLFAKLLVSFPSIHDIRHRARRNW